VTNSISAQKSLKPEKEQIRKSCKKECEISECPQPVGCLAEIVKDICNCCNICGKKEGQQCDLEVVNDQNGSFDLKTYKPIHGRCGTDLECVLMKDFEVSNSVTDNAICQCKDQKSVCGDDGRTYTNKCKMFEIVAGRRQIVQIIRYEPCDESPKIITPPKNIEEDEGSEIMLSCEISGYPTPKVEWQFTKSDGTILQMPGDDLRKSVSARGGPEQFQVTGWLHLYKLKMEDEGIYNCIGKNKLGKVSAISKILVRKIEL